jgi:hypothetical protein
MNEKKKTYQICLQTYLNWKSFHFTSRLLPPSHRKLLSMVADRMQNYSTLLQKELKNIWQCGKRHSAKNTWH